MNTVTNIGVGLTTQASNTNWTQLAQQTTILNSSAVNSMFLRGVVLSTNGVKVYRGNVAAGINLADIIEAIVTVQPNLTSPPNITGQPSNIFANQLSGSTVNISSVVEFPTVTPPSYIWQISNTNGNSWTNIINSTAGGLTNANISNWNTNIITFNPLNNAANFEFRCQAYSNAGNSNSNVMFIETISPPANVTVAHPNAANFSVLVTSKTLDTFSYLWQISTDGGTTYTNLADNTIYAGSSTNFLTINNSTGLNGFRYRVGVSNGTSTPNSNNAVLTVT